MARLPPTEVRQLLEQAVPWLSPSSSQRHNGPALRALLQGLARRPDFETELAPQSVDLIESLYRATPPAAELRGEWLGWLARGNSEACVMAWVRLLADDPPLNELAIPHAVEPLLRRGDLPETFYSQVLAGPLAHPQLAPVMIDIMNYQTRNQIVKRHPAAGHIPLLSELLRGAVRELKRIESGELPPNPSEDQMRRMVADGLALVVSLCDALGLCGHHSAESALFEASQLKHRQIQTEAAAALARLHSPAGAAQLISLAAEPVARLRVLTYAEELGLTSEIPEDYRTDLALAEGKLALWLADPQRVGVAPGQIELVEARELYWPSYEHPVLCYLFRFRYSGPESAYENFGLVGPLVHVFAEDLHWLELDDLFAAFAGWQAEHPEIYELAGPAAEQAHPELVQRTLKLLRERNFHELNLELVGHFFGEWIAVVAAQTDNSSGFALVNNSTIHWFGNHEEQPVSASFAYMIYRGRRMLQAFNEPA